MYEKIVYRAGVTVDVTKCYTHRNHPQGVRGAPKKRTPEEIARANRKAQERKLTRILNANFQDGDLYITLSYREELRPGSIEEVKKDLTENVIRKLRAKYKKAGHELKYVYALSMGESGENPHIHMVVNDPENKTLRLIESLWVDNTAGMELKTDGGRSTRLVSGGDGYYVPAKGFIKPEPLYTHGQYRDLAVYLIRNGLQGKMAAAKCLKEGNQAGEEEGGMKARRSKLKAFEHSRNLIIPQPERTVIKAGRFRERIRVPKGYVLEPGSIKKGTDWGGWPYLSYTLIWVSPPGNRRGRDRCG